VPSENKKLVNDTHRTKHCCTIASPIGRHFSFCSAGNLPPRYQCARVLLFTAPGWDYAFGKELAVFAGRKSVCEEET
jgi:hypothetical protein